jgi:hypothetical protein
MVVMLLLAEGCEVASSGVAALWEKAVVKSRWGRW